MVHTRAVVAHQIARGTGLDDGAEVRRLHAGPVRAEIRLVGGAANARRAGGAVLHALARRAAVGSVGRTGRELGTVRESGHAELAGTEHRREGGTDRERGAEREVGHAAPAGTGELGVRGVGQRDGARGTEQREGTGERGVATGVVGTLVLADGADDLEERRLSRRTLLGQTISRRTISPLRQSFMPLCRAAAWASSM